MKDSLNISSKDLEDTKFFATPNVWFRLQIKGSRNFSTLAYSTKFSSQTEL